jgi:hypothetical protein
LTAASTPGRYSRKKRLRTHVPLALRNFRLTISTR